MRGEKLLLTRQTNTLSVIRITARGSSRRYAPTVRSVLLTTGRTVCTRGLLRVPDDRGLGSSKRTEPAADDAYGALLASL